MVTLMERDKLPLPRFWYLPRGEKAVVVMSGDDHSPSQAPGGTASNFDRFKQLSPAGCVVANWTINALLDNAVGANGYYGAFGVNIHTDNAAPNANNEAIVTSAQTRDVPIVSYRQLLEWTDGRNDSTIRDLAWSNGTFTFVTTVGAGADGLQTLLPTQGPTGTLSGLTCGGSPTSYTTQTIKGVQYAMFPTITGTCEATYS